MNIQFLNPLFLIGLGAAVLPILIHRLTRRKATVRRFSAVRLLLKSQQARTKPHKLKHFFILALRVLSIAGIIFLMAEPILIKPGYLSLKKEGNTVIILDNSLSMGYKEDRASRYEIAKNAAREIIKQIKGEMALLVTTSLNKDTHWLSKEEAFKELERIHLSYNQGNPLAALKMAYTVLKDKKEAGEVLILSDLARGDWEGFDLSKLEEIPSLKRVNFLRIGGAQRDPNVTIKGLELMEGEAITGVPTRLRVEIVNLSDQPREILVHLYLSGIKKEQKSVALNARDTGSLHFELIFDRPGWVDGEIKIAGDALSLDDIFYFSLLVREKIKILVVDGDPRISPKGSESYFLTKALQPGGPQSSPFHPQVITEAEFSDFDLKGYEALFLLNVAQPQIYKLLSVLDSGKPVFIFLGDRVNPDEYNTFPLSPWKIGELRETKPLPITGVDQSHPFLKNIIKTGKESLRSGTIRYYFKIEGKTRHLLTLANGDPLLLEANLAKGKVFLFSSSADLEWNDLPLQAVYLPLIQTLLKEAVGLTADAALRTYRIGDVDVGKKFSLSFSNLELKPGIYKAALGEREVKAGLNPPFVESDLSKVSMEELKKMFGKMEIQVIQYSEDVLQKIHSGRKELWPIILVVVLLILAGEMTAAGKV